MPDVELRADFDRDGRLSGSAREYAARGRGPGAIIGVNVDRDDRALPRRAQVVSAVALDFERPVRVGQDRDPLPLRIDVSAAAVSRFSSISLRVMGANADGVMLLDARRRPVVASSVSNRRVDFPLPHRAGRHRFQIEGRRVPGSPLGRPQGALVVRVVGFDPAGEHTVDEGRFQLARFIVIDDLSPAEKLYICRVPDNVPSLQDVRRAMRGVRPRVALREIAATENRNDAWIQDQFQLGYLGVPGRPIRVVLHMPRLRRNAQLGVSQNNLAELVRTHFPSANLGLVEDYWKRRVRVNDLSAGMVMLRFEESEQAFRVLHRTVSTYLVLRDAIQRLCAAAGGDAPPECATVPPLMTTLPTIRTQIPELLRLLEAIARRMLRSLSGDAAKRVRGARARARAQGRRVQRMLPMSGTRQQRVFEVVMPQRRLRLNSDALLDLHETVRRMHDSLVYGGNVEASPPEANQPFGKVVIGEGSSRLMDPELRDLFDSGSRIQPVVTVDTGWLGVGHVDELISFLPNRRRDGRHAVLRASPHVAMELIDAASELYHAGLPIHHPDKSRAWRPLTLQRHVMREGAHPMTRLLRGKLWLHSDTTPDLPNPEEEANPQAEADAGEVMLPPNIYLAIVDWFSGLLSGTNAPYYPDRAQQGQYYPAALSVWELQFFEGNTSATLEGGRLRALDEQLRREFSRFPVLHLPVIFDRIIENSPTAAFTPNLVNLQYVNGTALIPHPFGPRMKPRDAAAVIRRVLTARGLGRAAGRVSPAYFRRNRLDRTVVWMNWRVSAGRAGGPFTGIDDVAREFRDGFPDGMSLDDIRSRILRANPNDFDGSGDLKEGWKRIVIPERTVDLFQAYTHVVLDSLRVRPAWIDTWYYHVRFGEIHCGTNVLRRAPSRVRDWWSRLGASGA